MSTPDIQPKDPSTIYSGHAHGFDVGIARTVGVNAAIVFNHIVYWLKINAAKEINQIDGKTWMYETQADIAKCLDYMTLEEVKKAVVKLLDTGLLIKENYNKNPFDKTAWYTTSDQRIIEIKKTLTKAPYGAIDNAVGRNPTRPTAPCIYKENKQEEHTKRTTTAASPPAAVSFQSLEKKEPKIHPVLESIDIPLQDKIEISSKYSIDQVSHAIEWALHPQTKLNKSLAAAIKWACQTKPTIPQSSVDIEIENKNYALKYDGMKNAYCQVNVLNKFVEITNGVRLSTCIKYCEKGFMEQFISALRKSNLNILE